MTTAMVAVLDYCLLFLLIALAAAIQMLSSCANAVQLCKYCPAMQMLSSYANAVQLSKCCPAMQMPSCACVGITELRLD